MSSARFVHLASLTKHMRLLFVLTACAAAVTLLPVEARAGALGFDAAGNLFVADFAKRSVFKYTPDGTKSTFVAGLKGPIGLCFDSKGNLFVSDEAATTFKGSILKFTPEGKRSTFATGISLVGGMAFDHSGNLFVSEENSIFKFSPEGVKSTVVTSKLANFIGLAFDGSENLFVADQAIADTGAGRSILKFSPDGTKTIFARGLEDPVGLTADNAGSVYVVQRTAADASSHAILKFSPNGARNTFTSELGRSLTTGLAVDSSGNVFAANDRLILKFDANGTKTTFASDWISPDKQWEYKCAEYGLGQCAPEIVKAGTSEVVVDLDQDLNVYDPESNRTDVIWAPDSRRFACNYSPPHAHHTTYETVAFYQLRGDKWVEVHSPVDAATERLQLAQLAKNHLPKSFNPRHCVPDRDVLKLRNWTDADTAILYAPCYGRTSGELDAAFLFTLKFDDAGNWKVVKTHQMSEKEVEASGD